MMSDKRIVSEVFIPPPFITTPVDPARIVKKSSNGNWWPLTEFDEKYDNCSIIFNQDLHMLRSLIKWKWQQLCVVNEAAVASSDGVSNLAEQWRDNQLNDAVWKFKDAFPQGRVSDSAGEVWLPSYQWLQWTIYVVLKEAAILAKIKLDCETVLGIWHTHLEDKNVLLIFTVISRMWYLASIMVEELNSKIYPFLFRLTNVIQPVVGSVEWPNYCPPWIVPNPVGSFMDWLEKTFDLAFEPARNNHLFSSFMRRDSNWMWRLFEEYGIPNKTSGNTDAAESQLAEELVQASHVVAHSKPSNERTHAVASSISDSDSDPGIHIMPMPIKKEPHDSSDHNHNQDIEDEYNTRSSDSESDSSDETPTTSVKVKTGPEELPSSRSIEIIDISDSDGEIGESRDKDHIPPAKKAKPQISQPLTSNQAQEGDDDPTDATDFDLFNETKRVNSVAAFEQYWKLFFNGINPGTSGGRKEMLLRIDKCKFHASPRGRSKLRKSVIGPYRELLETMLPHLVNLEKLVKKYHKHDPSFVFRLKRKRNTILSEVEKLAKLRTELVMARKEKRLRLGPRNQEPGKKPRNKQKRTAKAKEAGLAAKVKLK